MVELLLIRLKIILEIMIPKSSAKLVIKSQIISVNILVHFIENYLLFRCLRASLIVRLLNFSIFSFTKDKTA